MLTKYNFFTYEVKTVTLNHNYSIKGHIYNKKDQIEIQNYILRYKKNKILYT